MSRTVIILIVVLSAALAALLFLSDRRANKPSEPVPIAAAPATSSPAAASPTTPAIPQPGVRPTAPPLSPAAPVTTPPRRTTNPVAIAMATNVPGGQDDDLEEPLKPLPVLERDYRATTNRETRLDIMMDIAESPGPESVRALTRLFEMETDPELKIDLLDSLLGIEEFKDEKLVLLTLGIRQGLPADVRQSAIDGLIDLEDVRAIALLNGLLNDPDEEIREAAQDALDILQSPQELPKAR